MKITVEQAKDIIFEEFSEDFIVVEVNDWVREGKYEVCTAVISDGVKYFKFDINRTGSYYTDWYYEWEDVDEISCQEVEKQEVVVVKWVRV